MVSPSFRIIPSRYVISHQPLRPSQPSTLRGMENEYQQKGCKAVWLGSKRQLWRIAQRCYHYAKPPISIVVRKKNLKRKRWQYKCFNTWKRDISIKSKMISIYLITTYIWYSHHRLVAQWDRLYPHMPILCPHVARNFSVTFTSAHLYATINRTSLWHQAA